jgi:nucleotide-binding universal stress UspA family protein
MEHLLVAWNGDERARRAVVATMPWLTRAAQVSVLRVVENRGQADVSSLLNILSYSGVKASMINVQKDNRHIGDIILHEAHRVGADAIVMGAYHRYRLLDWLFRSVTNYLINEADMPLFLMH